MSDRDERGEGGGGATVLVIVTVLGILALVALVMPGGVWHRRHGGSNEASAIASLVVCLAGQLTFRKADYYGAGRLAYANPADGNGYVDLYRIRYPDDAGGRMVRLIDKSLADARGRGPDRVPKGGYFFEDMWCADGTIEFALCAYPAEYDKTGRNTYIINQSGIVYTRDNGGRPVSTWPKDPDAEGWLRVDGGA